MNPIQEAYETVHDRLRTRLEPAIVEFEWPSLRVAALSGASLDSAAAWITYLDAAPSLIERPATAYAGGE